jgi:hypothetical protein
MKKKYRIKEGRKQRDKCMEEQGVRKLFWCEGQERRENEGKEINWVKKLEDQG